MKPAKRIASIRAARQDELLSWYAKQPKPTRLQVHAAKMKIFRTWLGDTQADGKNESFAKEELDYLALIAAISDIKRQIDEPKKQKDFELRTQQIISQRKNKKAPVLSKIEEFLPLIHQLRCQGLSWREVQDYIHRHHYKRFGVSTLHKVYMAEHDGVLDLEVRVDEVDT